MTAEISLFSVFVGTLAVMWLARHAKCKQNADRQRTDGRDTRINDLDCR